MSSNIRIPKVCQYCDGEFIAKTTVTKFCSLNCARKSYKKAKKEQKLNNVGTIDQQKFNNNFQSISSKEFLSIADTCYLLGASRMTLYRYIKNGTIKVAKIGRRIIIRRSDIETLFN